MNRTLLLIAALLAPSLAYAGGPSADLSVQIIPSTPSGGVACDIGPSYSGSVPAEASQAGLTHCAANYDFTNTSNWTYKGATYNFADRDGAAGIANWLDCSQFGTGSGLWHIGIQGFPSWGGCSNINMITDPTVGKQVLDITYPSGTNSIESIATQGSDGTGPIEMGFAYTYYIETMYRMPALCPSCSANQAGPNGLFVWSNFNPPAGPGGNLEDDLGEIYLDSGGFGDKGWINWGAGNCGAGACIIPASYKGQYPAGWSGQTYAKYGTLVTTNASGTDYRWCTYLNDTLIGGQCYDVPGTPNTSDLNNEVNTLILQTQGNNNPQNYDLYTQYIRIYVCAGFKNPPTNSDPASRCYGQSALTSGPRGELFYHQ